MIPKIIHYVWFGKKSYPPKIQYCIDSWKKFLPDYKFIRWDESNFDVNSVPFTRQAFEKKQWAFIADYVRVAVLFEFGGWYLDTDVELLKPLSIYEDKSVVFGTDEGGSLTAVYGSEPHNDIWKNIRNVYRKTNFIKSDGTLNQKVINQYIQEEISRYGYVRENKYQDLGQGIIVYPDDYFHVQSLEKGVRHFTENSTCIHWQTMLWTSKKSRLMRYFRLHVLRPTFGDERFMTIWETVTRHFKKRRR